MKLDGIPADIETTAIAVIVAPERLEDVVATIPPSKLLPTLWYVEEILRRANALKKALLIESALALSHMALDPRLGVNGHHYILRQDSRQTWKDLGTLLGMLETVHGIPGEELHAAVSDARVTALRIAAEKIADPDLRADALASIEDARVKVPTALALIDLDDPYRKGRR